MGNRKKCSIFILYIAVIVLFGAHAPSIYAQSVLDGVDPCVKIKKQFEYEKNRIILSRKVESRI